MEGGKRMKVLTIHDDGSVEEVDLDTIASSPVRLTPRERQVLAAVAEGRRNVEIAADLGLAPKTVKVHVRAVLGKRGLKDRRQAAEGFGHAASVAALVSQMERR